MKEIENNQENIIIDPATDVSVTIPTEGAAPDFGIGYGIFDAANVDLFTRFQPRNFPGTADTTFRFSDQNYSEFYIWLMGEKGMSVDEAFHITNDRDKLTDAVEEFNDFIRNTGIQELDKDGNTVAADPEKLLTWPKLYKKVVDKLTDYKMPDMDYSDPKQMADYAGQSLLIGNVLQACYNGMESALYHAQPHPGAEVYDSKSRRLVEKTFTNEDLERCEQLANSAFTVTAHLQAGYDNIVIREDRQKKTQTIHNLDDMVQVRFALNGLEGNKIAGASLKDAADSLEKSLQLFGPVTIATTKQQVGDQIVKQCKVEAGEATAAIGHAGILKDADKAFAFLQTGGASALAGELDTFINGKDAPAMDALAAYEEKITKEANAEAKKRPEEIAQKEAQEKARKEAEERAQKEAEEKARKEAEEKARKEAQEKVQKEEKKEAQKEAVDQQAVENRQAEKKQPDAEQMKQKWQKIMKVNGKIALLHQIGDMHQQLLADREALRKTQKDKDANFDLPGKPQGQPMKEEGSEYYKNMTRALNKVIRLTDPTNGQQAGDFRDLQQALKEYKRAATQYEKTRNVFYKAIFDNGKKRLEASQKAMDKTERFLETLEIYEKRGTIGEEFVGGIGERKDLSVISEQVKAQAAQTGVNFDNIIANTQARQIKEEHAKVADQRVAMRRLLKSASDKAGADISWDGGIVSTETLPKNWDRAADYLKWSYERAINRVTDPQKGERMLAVMQQEKFPKHFEKEIKGIVKDKDFQTLVVLAADPEKGFEAYHKVHKEKLKVKDNALKLKEGFQKTLDEMSKAGPEPFSGLEGQVTNAIYGAAEKDDAQQFEKDQAFSQDKKPDPHALEAGYLKLGLIVTLQILSGPYSAKMRKAIVKNGEGEQKDFQDAVTKQLKDSGMLKDKSYAEINEKLGPALSDGSLAGKVFDDMAKDRKIEKDRQKIQQAPEQEKNLQSGPKVKSRGKN